MKILMIAIPNHHFFQWVNQLKNSGYKVYWFDITDGGQKSDKIKWVSQIKGWKLKWNFPLRTTIKKRLPKLYKFIQKYNEKEILSAFEKTYNNVKPDIIHVFEMQLSGLPILPVLQKTEIPLIYSSWGSDLFYKDKLGVSQTSISSFLNRVDYLITDCKRDSFIAVKLGFKGIDLGVFPGNGGLNIEKLNIKAYNKRPVVLIKGYEDGVGKASIVLKALEQLPQEILEDKRVVVYSADEVVKIQIQNSKTLSNLKVKVYTRSNFINNKEMLKMMGESCIHIANSLSDGMPNALLEAMAMGAFPIQSNPGQVTEEVVTHNVNGLLITNPLDVNNIASLIKVALKDDVLRQQAQDYNIKFINTNYNRVTLQSKIIKLYRDI